MTTEHATNQQRTGITTPPTIAAHRARDNPTSNGDHDGHSRLEHSETPHPAMTPTMINYRQGQDQALDQTSASPQLKASPNDSHDGHNQHGQSLGHGNQEQGLRVEKRRRMGGGFLLPSALRHGSGTLRHRTNDSTRGKGKGKASVEGAADAAAGGSLGLTPPPARSNGSSMRSSPLAQVVVSHRPISHGGSTRSRPSTDVNSRPMSLASSSQPRASSDYTLEPDGSLSDSQQGGGIDAAQIVNMALNLSEGRRRHISAGQLLQQQAGGARRSTSIAMPSPAMMQGSFQNAGTGIGGSLKQALGQQKGRSRNNSPGSAGKGTPKRHASNALPFLASDAPGANFGGPDMFYRFSPSTLARAEKARQYIELSVEYRRLLDYLPPLRPDSNASGNYEYITHSVPGSPFVELVRSPTNNRHVRHELGRPYNPLQMIRNRKLRMRNRMQLKPDVDHFSDTNTVREWIDVVQNKASRPDYRTEDKVRLPAYPEDENISMPNGTVQGHGRQESTTKARQRSDWSFAPMEHLADAYWMELDANKRMIENHVGNKILPPLAANTDLSQPRASYESYRSHRGSYKGSISTSVGSYDPPAQDSDSDEGSAKGHRHRHHLHLHRRDESRGRLKRVLHKARHRSPSSSSNLSSSDEGPMGEHVKKKSGSLRVTSGGHNISALEKHLEARLQAQDQSKSPDLISPGTPNKWGLPSSGTTSLKRESKPKAQYSDSDHVPSDSNIKDYGKLGSRLTPDSARGQRGRNFESGSSFEDLSTNQNSPVVGARIPPISTDLSPGASRIGSRTGSPSRLGKPLLPFIRTEQEKQRKQSLNSDGYQSSRQTSAEVTSNPRGSLDVPRVIPATPERAKLHRHKTSDGILETTPQYRDGKEEREPQSAVRRFFKGGRIGEIVRNEGRGRKRGSVHGDNLNEIGNPDDTESMEESDTEETDVNLASIKDPPNALQRTNTGWSTKYNSDKLPSFRSTKDRGHGRRGSDHIAKQQRELSSQRSPRLDKLQPPGLDLTRIQSSSSNFADISRTSTQTAEARPERRNAQGFAQHNRNRSRLGQRLEAILDVPGTVGSGGLPVTGLADIANERPPKRPGLKDKRQWSISDRHRSQSRDPRAPLLDYFEIARVRALLMCSGIKATTVLYRGDEVRSPVPAFLTKAADTCHVTVKAVKRSEEHVLAAKLLTNHLEAETSALHDDTDRFLRETVASLKKELGHLRESVDSAIKTTQNLGDTCVGFGSEVTGQRTLQVRQVVDQLEKLARTRRRRLRWLRRLGFGMGEWLVVLVLWTAWFLVVILKTVFKVVRGLGSAARWVLWM